MEITEALDIGTKLRLDGAPGLTGLVSEYRYDLAGKCTGMEVKWADGEPSFERFPIRGITVVPAEKVPVSLAELVDALVQDVAEKVPALCASRNGRGGGRLTGSVLTLTFDNPESEPDEDGTVYASTTAQFVELGALSEVLQDWYSEAGLAANIRTSLVENLSQTLRRSV